MIKIQIIANGEEVLDSFETDKTTLIENAVTIRRLEEIKQKLLDFKYESEIEVSEDEDKE